jgi:DNA-binding transcriptional MerR regulator
MSTELTLEDLVAASGINARTIRSWIDQGLVPRPSTTGPKASYPADALPRLLAAKTLRYGHGMALPEIRNELTNAPWARIEELAARAAATTVEPEGTKPGALEYLANLRKAGAFRGVDVPAVSMNTAPGGASALATLAERVEVLAGGRRTPRTAKARTQTVFAVTPDIEIVVRGTLGPEEIQLYERIADHFRTILTGGSL